MIEVKDLHKTFKQQEVLKGISFSIEKGETVSRNNRDVRQFRELRCRF